MNIANIFGLHLGCRTKCRGEKKTGFVFRVLPDYEDIDKWDVGVIFWNEKKTWSRIHDFPITDCKLLLKPLSDMSDEDKREFEKEFCESYIKVNGFFIEDNQLKMKAIDTRSLSSTAILYENLFARAYPTLTESLWLCSKGYDVGIVPDEYKEI